MLKVRVGDARMHLAALVANCSSCLHLPARGGGGRATRHARVHQPKVRGSEESVVDEIFFLDRELGVVKFQITCAIAAYTLAQDQVLGAGGSADRIGLHESEPVDRALQRRWRKQ